MSGIFIIAEAGVNHNGSLEIAMRMIDAAKIADADAVKFQTFTADRLLTRSAEKAHYQKNAAEGNESQYEMIKRLELDREAHEKLFDYCGIKGIEFLSTAFDIESIDLLASLGMRRWKIPSGEITNLPYLRKIGLKDDEIILSTGMADLGDIEDAIEAIEEAGTSRNRITLLHCTTEYPAPFAEVNLRAMETMARAFGVRVGYSDHTEGIEIPIAAAALGASVIEKHFTLDKRMTGPDHKASLEPSELSSMIRAVRKVEKALGGGIKRPTASELKNVNVARKSIVAARRISKGERFTDKNLATKRPGNGISPMEWDRVVGTIATQDYAPDEIILP